MLVCAVLPQHACHNTLIPRLLTSFQDLGGVLSNNATENDLHSYTRVFIKYCDGSSFSSARSEPYPYVQPLMPTPLPMA